MKPARIVTGDGAGVAAALAALQRGAAIGMPTETVYGLAADASNPDAVAGIYALKARPRFNPLIAHVADIDMARLEGDLDARAAALAAAFWPGPLTLVVPAAAAGRTCELARAGLATIALRVPAHPLAQTLLAGMNGPIAAPSANPSGRLSPTSAAEVAAELGSDLELVLDGGRCQAGIESTIVALLPDTPATLLRPGAIAREAIEAITGPLAEASGAAVTAPGQLQSHYAPRAQLRLNADRPEPGEVLLWFGPSAPRGAVNLSPSGDLTEAAARLYQLLRQLDASGAATIAVMPIPATGLGEAINDRLRRAAAPR
ncbi:MAG: L-threonylcarbamoyladenylate synthase [Gammaproteobacteria bacterium]|jgi:L-threonylcarbamoyladenylate synthase|nr:L-threonylcarbamoyladenylate synthase [Gammaproteobacteria bacterium]